MIYFSFKKIKMANFINFLIKFNENLNYFWGLNVKKIII